MFFEKSFIVMTFLFAFNIQGKAALLMPGSSNSTSTMSVGQHFSLTEVMQILQNQTGELMNLKQQTESDRSTIQLLQNRVFFLEAELRKLNASKPPSSDELSAYLSNMKQIVQTMTENEEYDKNTTKRLNDVVSNLENLKVQMRYSSLSLLDVHSKTEQLNTTLLKVFNDGMNGVNEQIANISRKVAFSASMSSGSNTWNSGTLVFPAVITNVGNGYNPSNGIFTAPINGNYVFFVNVQSYNENDIYVDIVLNGSTKVRTMALTGGGDYYDAGPNLVVLTLQKGDTVWVRYYSGQGYYSSGPITTFSGFLI